MFRCLGTGEIQKVKLSGVEESFEKHSKEAESKGVKAHFRLDESGLVVLESVRQFMIYCIKAKWLVVSIIRQIKTVAM